MSRIVRQPELPALTGLRFWAAFFILLNHLLLGFISRENPWLKNLLNAGGILGMNTFFILSGFIIHYNYHAKLKDFSAHSFYEFFVARFSRLYPLFICLFFVDFFATNLTLQRFNPDDVCRSLKYFLTMSQSWFYLPTSTGETITYMYPRASIAWSISTEMLMYSCYPLLLLAFSRDRAGYVARGVLVGVLALMLSLGLRWLNNNMGSIDRLGVEMFGEQAAVGRNVSFSFAFWFVYLSPYVRVFEFIIGAMTAQVFLRLRDHPVGPREVIVMPLLGLLAMLFILATFLPDAYAIAGVKNALGVIGYYPSLAIIIFVAARYGESLVCRFFSIKTFTDLGERSYSIYLFHIFVVSAATHLPDTGMPTAIRIVVLWITVFASANVLYQFIEMPARKKVRDSLLAAYPAMVRGWRRMFA
jgi:peptidoglycan/LPS O-acetylase OafA/YrhL